MPAYADKVRQAARGVWSVPAVLIAIAHYVANSGSNAQTAILSGILIGYGATAIVSLVMYLGFRSRRIYGRGRAIAVAVAYSLAIVGCLAGLVVGAQIGQA